LIFIDASFFIAAVNKQDQWHKSAGDILPLIQRRKKITTDLILSESVTLVGSLFGGKEGMKLFNYIWDNHEIYYLSKETIFNAMKTFLQHDGTLSFADSVSVEVMRNLKIDRIVSFDSDFDKVDVIRIHE